MAQSPITVIDGTETAAVARVEINGALEALATLSSGATAPSATFSGMFWHDTSTGILKIRSEADDAWINVGYLDQSTNEFKPYVGGTQVDTQSTATWEAGTSTTEGIVSPAKVKSAVEALGGGVDFQEFTSSGTWTKPSGATLVLIEVVGAGGSGAGTDQFNGVATGGGGGGAARVTLPASLFGSTESVTVGAGGSPVNDNDNNGNAGGDSTFGAIVTGYGGNRGEFNGTTVATTPSEPPGSDAGQAGQGGTATISTDDGNTYSPGTTSLLFGDGGAAGDGGGEDGGYPGGGGGATDNSGLSGAGGDGRVRVWAW